MISITRDIGLVSFTGNPIMLGVQSYNHEDGSGNPRPFYTIFCEIFTSNPSGGGDPYDVLSINPDANGVGQFDLAPVLKDLTKPTLPWPIEAETQAVKDTNATVSFWYRLRDGYGVPFVQQAVVHTSSQCYAIPGGLADSILEDIEDGTSNCYAFISSNKIFLTSIPEKKRTYPTQIELLRFFNYLSSGTGTHSLKLKQYMWDGTNSTTTVWSGSLDFLSLYSFNVTPSHLEISANAVWWEVWVEFSGADPVIISEKVSYRKNEEHPTNPRLFVMQNSLGGFDTLVAVGNRTLTSEGEAASGYVAKTSAVRKWLEPLQERRVTKSIYKGSLGYFTSDELNWLREFFMSPEKYLYDAGKLELIMLRQSDFPSDTDEPPGKIEIEAVLGSPFMFFFS